MKKDELITLVAEKATVSKKDAASVIAALTDVVMETVAKGEDVPVSGLGTFTTVTRAARTGRNPKTGETMEIAASRSPKLKISSTWKKMF